MLKKYKIDDEFESIIPPLSGEEFNGLEADIIRDGCTDPLTIWEGHDVILDGHNRHKICHKNNIFFRTNMMQFEDRDAAKIWIYYRQLNRRNLSDYQRAEIALGLKPLLAARAKENQKLSDGKGCQKSDNLKTDPIDVKKELARAAGVSHDTINKVERISKSPVVELSRMTREKKVSINLAAEVAELPEDAQREVVARGAQAVKDAAKLIKHAKRTAPKKKPFKAQEMNLEGLSRLENVSVTFPNNPIDAAAVLADRLPVEFVKALIARLQEIIAGK